MSKHVAKFARVPFSNLKGACLKIKKESQQNIMACHENTWATIISDAQTDPLYLGVFLLQLSLHLTQTFLSRSMPFFGLVKQTYIVQFND